MGVVNTTYTFTGTDTITSSKLNNIIDDTTFTGDAISGSSLQIVSPGKLAVAAGGITANELADSSVTQAKLAANVVGNGPAFFAYASVTQSLADSSTIKVSLGSEGFDTNNNFASSTFTAPIAGYYFISGGVYGTTANIELFTTYIYKNGSQFISGSRVTGGAASSHVSGIIQLNLNDTIDLYARQASGGTRTIASGRDTHLSGYLVRAI
jgi:hypothetical protein